MGGMNMDGATINSIIDKIRNETEGQVLVLIHDHGHVDNYTVAPVKRIEIINGNEIDITFDWPHGLLIDIIEYNWFKAAFIVDEFGVIECGAANCYGVLDWDDDRKKITTCVNFGLKQYKRLLSSSKLLTHCRPKLI